MNIVTIIANPKTQRLVNDQLRTRPQSTVKNFTALAEAKWALLAHAVDLVIAEYDENLFQNLRAISPAASCIVLMDTGRRLDRRNVNSDFRMLTVNLISQRLLWTVDQALQQSQP